MDRLYAQACPARDAEGVEEVQPKPGSGQSGDWVPGDIGQNIEQLYKLAPRAKTILDKEVAELADRAGLPADALVTVRLKGATDDPEVFDYTRIKEKAKGKYLKKHPSSDGLALVLDIVRMSIMCDTEHQMTQILDLLFDNPKLRIFRLKNLFKDLDAVHFRRLMVSVAVEVESGKEHIAELQIHIRSVANVHVWTCILKHTRRLPTLLHTL